MTTSLYDSAKAGGLLEMDLLGNDVYVVPVTQLYNPNFATHATLDDVPEATRAAPAVTLRSKVITEVDGLFVFDANNTSFPTILERDHPVTGLVMYAYDGSLIGFFDYFSNLPLATDGRTVVFIWPDGTNRIFSWTVV